jgi:hypothetical protein
VILRGFRCTERFLLADLEAVQRSFDLTRHVSDARVGINVDGADAPLGRQGQFAPGAAIVGRAQKPGFAAHPPWTSAAGVIGTVYAEWDLPVPQEPSRLEFAVGLRDGAEKSEGVTFLVHIDGAEVLRQDWKRCEWLPCRVDLSGYAGQTVKLRLSVDKGPEGRGSWAWAAWGEPALITEAAARDFPLEALLPGRGGVGLVRRRVPATAPGQVCLTLDQPAEATLPLDLLGEPFSWAPLVGGVPMDERARPGYLGASVGRGMSAGVERRALIAHPPIGGATAVDYLLALPAGARAELSTAVAVQDGAKGSNGLDFLVTVNGTERGRVSVGGPDGWRPLAVDLTPWAGQTVVLSLVADARGEATSDWARWAEPAIRSR